MSSKKFVLAAGFSLLMAGMAFAEKYDGTWNFRVISTHGSCIAAPGVVTIKNGRITGSVDDGNSKLRITGKVSDEGEIKGRIAGGLARYEGKLGTGTGSAKWTGRRGCKGKIIIN